VPGLGGQQHLVGCETSGVCDLARFIGALAMRTSAVSRTPAGPRCHGESLPAPDTASGG
jgi:hypothetical protein